MDRLGARLAVAALVAALSAACAPSAGAQRTTLRFYVDSVADSTFAFRLAPEDDWVRVGTKGIAVDPARRDALVAEYRVISVWGDRAIALVTAQTTVVTMNHIALLAPPERRFYRSRSFWTGTVLGVVLGVGGGLLLGGA